MAKGCNKRGYDKLARAGDRKFFKLEIKHLHEKIKIIKTLGDVALEKALTTNNERLDASNHKYALLKEQTATFPNRSDLQVLEEKFHSDVKIVSDRVDALCEKLNAQSKIINVGLGLVIAFQFFVGIIVSLAIKFL